MNGFDARMAPVTGLTDFLKGRPRALRAGEVAALLNVSERLIYKLASERRLPAFRIGGALRFDPAALAHWLRDRTQLGG